MFQINMFSFFRGRLGANRRIVFTMFGGCELHRPTLARQLLSARHHSADERSARRHAAITIFGSTEIKAPTLAEEFLDMREAIGGGALPPDALDRLAGGAAGQEDNSVFSLTLFGALNEAELPSEDEEVDSLALQRHLGNISDSAAQFLQLGVGQSDAHRRAVVHQAIAANGGTPALA